jgi:hypothetical protein
MRPWPPTTSDELHLAIAARTELGDEMEPAVVDVFVERIQRRLADRAHESERALQRKRDHQKEMVLGSMAISGPAVRLRRDLHGPSWRYRRLRRSCPDRGHLKP